jgi:acetate kinase
MKMNMDLNKLDKKSINKNFLILLEKIGHRLGNFGEIFNESTVITSQSKKTSDVLS